MGDVQWTSSQFEMMNFVPFILIIVSASAPAQEKINLYEDREEMRNEILTHIPIGTAIETTEKIMEKNKFSCEKMKDEEFMAGSKTLFPY